MSESDYQDKLTAQLHLAIHCRDAAQVCTLVKLGANLEAVNPRTGFRPVEAAVRDAPTLKVLVMAGARIDPQDAWGYPLIYRALSECAFDSIEFLIDCGADLVTHDAHGHTVMNLFAKHAGFIPLLSKAIATQPKSLVDIQDKYGDTGLHIAFAERNLPMIRILLAAGADVTVTNNRGYSFFDWVNNKDPENQNHVVPAIMLSQIKLLHERQLLSRFNISEDTNQESTAMTL